jgi:hypothetical protein
VDVTHTLSLSVMERRNGPAAEFAPLTIRRARLAGPRTALSTALSP